MYILYLDVYFHFNNQQWHLLNYIINWGISFSGEYFPRKENSHVIGEFVENTHLYFLLLQLQVYVRIRNAQYVIIPSSLYSFKNFLSWGFRWQDTINATSRDELELKISKQVVEQLSWVGSMGILWTRDYYSWFPRGQFICFILNIRVKLFTCLWYLWWSLWTRCLFSL